MKEGDKFRLIKEIHKRPLLWDFRHFYESRNNKKIDELWQEIGKILDFEVSLCKLRWQKLRAAFLNEMKRIPDRIAKAKKKGTYDPRNKYSRSPFFDVLKFVAYGRSLRGVHSARSVKNSAQEQFQKVNKFENVSFPSESNKRSENIIVADLETKSNIFKSYTVAFYTKENEYGNPYYNPEVDKDILCHEGISQIEKHKSTTVSKPELTFNSANPKAIIEQNKYKKNNQNQSEGKSHSYNNWHLQQKEAANSGILDFQKYADYKLEVDNNFEIKPSTVTKKELVFGNISDKSNQSVLLGGEIFTPTDFCDPEYKFLHSLVPRLKQMSDLQKLKFRAEMSSLILDIFSSVPVTDLDRRVLSSGDNDPDKKFLISFLPLIKSMPRSQNMKFQAEIADLVLNMLSFERPQPNVITR